MTISATARSTTLLTLRRTTVTNAPRTVAPLSPECILSHNKALSAFIRRGRLREAEALFRSSPHRTVVTWNSMLHAYALHRHLALAQRLFDQMPQRNLVSWNTLLLAYCSSRDPSELRRARHLFDRMPQRDLVSWNTMLRGYAASGKMSDAHALFRAMPDRNAVSWNTMVHGLLAAGRVEEGTHMFRTMPARDHSSLSVLVAGLARNGAPLESAEALVLSEWCSGATDGVLDAMNTLIAGYGRRGMVANARAIFDMIPEKPCKDSAGTCRNVITWNSMMMCYVVAGDVCEARRLFDSMPWWDVVSWNTMIGGYVQVLDMHRASLLFAEMHYPDERTWNLMISGYSKSGDLVRARECFDQMPRRNIVSWNTMITASVQHTLYEGAIALFVELRSSGGTPDRHTFSSLLGACAGLASVELGRQLHQHITKTFLPDIPISNSLITMYSRCGDLKCARFLFDNMPLNCRDFITWNAMIGGLAQHGRAVEALEVFTAMTAAQVKPTHITFVSILSACCHSGLVTEGQRQFGLMAEEFGIAPTVEHYALLVNLLGRSGRLEEAVGVIDGMPVQPDKSVWGALLDACRIHNNCELARVAADALLQVDPDSAAPHVVLYNMYMDMGRREDAVDLRVVLDGNGIRKQPGCSWMELQGSVHNFVAGDRSHRLMAEVYELLERYERIARDVNRWDGQVDVCL